MTHSLLLPLLLVSVCWAESDDLVAVVMVSRHGTRAANQALLYLCPANYKNIEAYQTMGLSAGGLTGRGMTELFALGKFTKDKYVGANKLVPEHYNMDHVYVQAVQCERTLQSSVMWGEAIWGPGTAPEGAPKRLPTPLAPYSIPMTSDNELEARIANCAVKLAQDTATWDANQGAELFAQHAKEIQLMSDICQNNLSAGTIENLGDAVKDVTDSWTFDFFSGFDLMPGLTLEDFDRSRWLAVANLFGRLYYTDEQKTYMSGSFPDALVSAFEQVVRGPRVPGDPQAKFYSYHGHRELLYALAFFFDVQLNFDAPGTPLIHTDDFHTSAIPPATTFFFELLTKNGSHFVRFNVWVPCGENDHPKDWPRPKDENCPATPYPLGTCAIDCPYDEFKQIILSRFESTGTWDVLCGANLAPFEILNSQWRNRTLYPSGFRHDGEPFAEPTTPSGVTNLVADSFSTANTTALPIIAFLLISVAILAVMLFKPLQKPGYEPV